MLVKVSRTFWRLSCNELLEVFSRVLVSLTVGCFLEHDDDDDYVACPPCGLSSPLSAAATSQVSGAWSIENGSWLSRLMLLPTRLLRINEGVRRLKWWIVSMESATWYKAPRVDVTWNLW